MGSLIGSWKNAALARNGATASIGDPAALRPSAAIDGDADEYGPTQRTADAPLNVPLTFTFAGPRRIGVLKFRLYDKDDRFYQYFVEVLTDGEWTKGADQTQGEHRSWQFIQFEPVVADKIRVVGTFGKVAPWLHVVELEAYDTDVADLVRP